MDRKESYRLAHPLSKISGYATASTPGQNGRSVRQQTHTVQAVLGSVAPCYHGQHQFRTARMCTLSPSTFSSLPLLFLSHSPFLSYHFARPPILSVALSLPSFSTFTFFYFFYLFFSFPSLPFPPFILSFHSIPSHFLYLPFRPFPFFDPPFLFPSFPVIFPETAWVSMACCLHYCGVSAIIRCARSSPSVRASSPASRLSRTGCSSSDTLKLCFAASRRAIADKISSTQRG